jgi:hypothetical protein
MKKPRYVSGGGAEVRVYTHVHGPGARDRNRAYTRNRPDTFNLVRAYFRRTHQRPSSLGGNSGGLIEVRASSSAAITSHWTARSRKLEALSRLSSKLVRDRHRASNALWAAVVPLISPLLAIRRSNEKPRQVSST